MSRPPIIGSPRFFRICWVIIKEGLAMRRERKVVYCPVEKKPGVIASWTKGAFHCTGCRANIATSPGHIVQDHQRPDIW